MREKLLEKIKNDKRIDLIISGFKDDFEAMMEEQNEEELKFINNFRESIYRKWLFSPMIQDTMVTPYFLMNSIAQNIEKGDYSITPHLRISYDERSKEFSYEFNVYYYGNDYIPVLKDLEVVMSFVNGTIIVNEEGFPIGKDFEKILKGISFRSAYYMEYLFGLAIKMDFLMEMKAIGCKCYQQGDSYKEYFNLSNKEKVELIIDKSIELSNEKLKDELDIKRKNIVLDYLDNDIESSEFLQLAPQDGFNPLEFLEDMEGMNEKTLEEFGLNKNDIMQMKSLKDNLEQDVLNKFLVKGEVAIPVDIHFTNVFAYYLGMTTSFYGINFDIEEFVDLFFEISNQSQIKVVLFGLEEFHDLTNFGQKIMGKKKNLKTRKFEFLEKEEINFALEEYLFKFEDCREQEIPEEIGDFIDEFGDYLENEKGIGEDTVERHCMNVFTYLVFFNNFKEREELKKISAESIDNFITNCYVPQFSTSKNSIKEQLTSLSQLIRYLEKVNILTKEEEKSIREQLKNREKYFKLFDSTEHENLFF
ncbi:MAG: site-specific integrase [Sarcina sp.]